MKRATVLAGICLLGIGLGLARSSQPQANPAETTQPKAKTAPAPASHADDEAAIHGLVGAFTKAFNAGDPTAVAALFTDNARVVTEDGRTVEGRPAIEKLFASTFQARPALTITIATENLRFLGTDAAIEEGTATTTSQDESGSGTPEATRYSVAYVKRAGKWLQDSLRDYPAETENDLTPFDHLKDLEGMVGEWIDQSDEGEVSTTCKWSDDKNFLLRSFTVHVRGQAVMTGSQRIGWDPRLKQIRSWIFDSEGGFSEGYWSRDGNRWIVKTTGYLTDGRTATATQIISFIDKDRMTWGSVDRTVGSEVLPDIEEFPLVRKPPQPKIAPSPAQPVQQPARKPQ